MGGFATAQMNDDLFMPHRRFNASAPKWPWWSLICRHVELEVFRLPGCPSEGTSSGLDQGAQNGKKTAGRIVLELQVIRRSCLCEDAGAGGSGCLGHACLSGILGAERRSDQSPWLIHMNREVPGLSPVNRTWLWLCLTVEQLLKERC